jgi:hypothetical protein
VRDVAALNAPIEENAERDEKVVVFSFGLELGKATYDLGVGKVGELAGKGDAVKEPRVVVDCAGFPGFGLLASVRAWERESGAGKRPRVM